MQRTSESGQGLTEYAFIIVLVAMLVIVALAMLGPVVGGAYSSILPKL